MRRAEKGRFVPYALLTPGWEAVYSGATSGGPSSEGNLQTDAEGNVINRWPVWTWLPEERDWDDQIRLINLMQSQLGPLSDDTRKVRAHIGSLVPCESSFPVSVDDLLRSIAHGKLDAVARHNGCWHSLKWDRPRPGELPGQTESMAAIERIVHRYLEGEQSSAIAADDPAARRFIERTFGWLGPRGELAELQRLLLEKMLLQFEFYTRRNSDRGNAMRELHREGGRGSRLDAQIARVGGFSLDLSQPAAEGKDDIRNLWARISNGMHGELCDCHHSAFRYIENWICWIGELKECPIAGRKPGVERERIGRTLFGYVLGLDRWLLGVPMQFLLLDLGHADLGFDPKNEVLRVYLNLGDERDPVREWLVACLWHTLRYNFMGWTPAGLIRHPHLIERTKEAGFGVDEWMGRELSRSQVGGAN